MTHRVSSLRLAALFLLSVTVIAYELAVMRAFSVGSWSNFGAMVISIALLGNGLAGTLLTFHTRSLREHAGRWLSVSAVLLGPAMAGAWVAAQHVPFNPVMIAADWRQLGWIGVYYLIYAVPFFIGAVFVGAIFVGMQERIHQLYFWNMVGSGLGGFVILGLMWVLPPAQLVAPLVVLAAGVALLCFVTSEGPEGRLDLRLPRIAVAAAAMFLSIVLVALGGGIRVSEFKPISYARQFPDAAAVYHTYGPTGDYWVYRSSYFHFAPGLSDNASLNVKRMPTNAFLGLYIDGDGPIGVMRKLQPDEEGYIDYLPMSAPYTLFHDPDVLLLRLAGAIGVYNALYHGSRSVWVAEPDATLVRMLRDVPFFRTYDGDLLRDPRVHVVHAEPRAFTTGTTRRFDLVELGLIDSVGLSQTGGYPLVQNYTYTVEGIDSYLGCLNPDGILSITVWNRLNPPRNVPELLSTVTAALRRRGVKDPGAHLFVFDNLLSTATILVKNSAFTASDLATLEGFLRKTSFTPAYYEGMPAPAKDFGAILDRYTSQFRKAPAAQAASVTSADSATAAAARPAPANAELDSAPTGVTSAADTSVRAEPKGGGLFDGVRPGASAADAQDALVPEDLYYFTTRWLLDGRAGELYRRYFFNIRPATDDRPYYTGYVKPATLPAVLRNMRSLSEEWGYVLEVGTFVLSILFGFFIILVPLAGRWRELFKRQPGTLRVIVYYGALGVGYMLVEIYLIQRLAFFLADPIFSNSVVITAMLVISGLGALAAGRYRGSRTRLMAWATSGIAAAMLFYLLVMPTLLDHLLGLPLPVKMVLAPLFVAPGAFFLGMPFPTGLSSLSEHRSGLIPWAWGMNGALSVTGTALALLVSITWGFGVVLFAVIGLYVLAFLVFSGNLVEARE